MTPSGKSCSSSVPRAWRTVIPLSAARSRAAFGPFLWLPYDLFPAESREEVTRRGAL